jgi:hypothetical protein
VRREAPPLLEYHLDHHADLSPTSDHANGLDDNCDHRHYDDSYHHDRFDDD